MTELPAVIWMLHDEDLVDRGVIRRLVCEFSTPPVDITRCAYAQQTFAVNRDALPDDLRALPWNPIERKS